MLMQSTGGAFPAKKSRILSKLTSLWAGADIFVLVSIWCLFTISYFYDSLQMLDPDLHVNRYTCACPWSAREGNKVIVSHRDIWFRVVLNSQQASPFYSAVGPNRCGVLLRSGARLSCSLRASSPYLPRWSPSPRTCPTSRETGKEGYACFVTWKPSVMHP